MKKIVLIVLLFFSALLFVGCDVGQSSTNKSDDKQNTEEDTNKDKTDEYKLIVNDDFGIIKNKLSGSYKAGEEIEVKIQFFSGLRAQVYLDEKELEMTSIEAYEYESFVFTMPNHDAILRTTINGYTKQQENCNDHKYENGHCIYCGAKETKDDTSDYNKFINIDSSCGLDLFVYNDNGTDKCVLFSHKKIMEESYGTIIDALLESIQDLLDNHSLTIDEMKEVFKTYAEDDLHYIIIHIVDKKVNYDDLKYKNIVDAKLTKRTEVANKLGLNISSELEGILLHPVFSSGVIYAKVGNELNISFDVFPTDYVYKNIYIKSSDESIVTIDNTCKASFISEGNAQIIFSIDGILEYYPVLVRNDDIDIITLPDEIKNISQDDLVIMSGFHSMISSYIFHSTNQDLLKYVLDLSLSIDYNEVLTNENRDPVAQHQDMQVSIQLAGDRSLNLTLTTESNIYLQYFVKENDEIVAKYEFKAYKPKQYRTLTAFCKMGMPSNHWWCETPACTQYYTGNYPIDEYMQETIVKTFIDHKSPLSNFYKNGTKFSGFISKSFGKFNGYYAVIVDGCGLCYYDAFTDVIVDGVKFTYPDSNQMYLIRVGGVLSLQEAFEKEIISHDDLVEISKRLNKSYDDKLVIDGTYYGKLCYTNPGLSSISVDMVFEISDTKLIINDDKELKIEEYEYDGHFFDNLDLALSYSLDYRQMFEYPNKGWFALLDSSETKKGGYSILISKFNTIYIFKTVFDLENDTYYIHAIYKLINQVEQTNVINSLFVDKYYFGMLLYVQPNLLSTREATSMTFQDDELIIGDNKYKLEEKIFDERFIKIDDVKLNNLFGFPSKGLIARIDDASYYCIIEGNDGIVYCLECAAINSEFYECDILCAYLLIKKIKLNDSFMYRTVDDKCDSKNIAEASKVNLIQVDMTFEEVVEILGKPVAALGSGAIWYEWSLNDGTSLKIQFTPKSLVDATLYVLRIERKYNFTNDCVLVVVKKEYSEINKVWNLDFFGDLPIKEVNDLTHRDNPDSVSNPSEFKQILKIVLKEPSYEGVLELIEELKKIDEFESAEPNYILTLY